jgi:uncharacterized membrane protein YphA (DoxX/SURF4 family)
MTRPYLRSPEELLRLGYAVIPLAAGADKFTNLLTDWEQYLAPGVARAVGMSPRTFMRLVGVIEMAVGTLVLTRFRKQAAYVASAWLAAISANLIAQGRYLDIAARDALLSLSAYALARLESPVRAQVHAPRRVPAAQRGPRAHEIPSPRPEEPSLVH